MRTLVSDLSQRIDQSVTIDGWVMVRRDQGKMVFFEIRDRSGEVQALVLPSSEALAAAKDISVQSAVSANGVVRARPQKNVQNNKLNGGIELHIDSITVIGKAQTLPFELAAELNLDTHLDYLPLTLRTQRSRDIFTLQAAILDAYRTSLKAQGFREFIAPALVGGDAEGGAAAFKVEYFKDTDAFLATSPQFYKQIMVGPFERAFTIAKIFRAEKSATTRHLSEATCMDFEMGFIGDEREPMMHLEQAIRETVASIASAHQDIFERFMIEPPKLPDRIPVFTLSEAHALIAKEFGRTIEDTLDMSPEDERQICQYAQEKHGSDFVFITRFPTKKRAFYTYESPDEAPFSRGFDLLFRGLEINSGAQRIHDYDMLVQRMLDRGLDPSKFSYYLQAFKYGMPPHGGCSTGLERFTARMLGIPNVKEATAFPRDMSRIDNRLSTDQTTGTE